MPCHFSTKASRSGEEVLKNIFSPVISTFIRGFLWSCIKRSLQLKFKKIKLWNKIKVSKKLTFDPLEIIFEAGTADYLLFGIW